MKRDEWTFEYTGKKLAAAAKARLNHHQTRMDYWKGEKEEVMATIRKEGLEIDEKQALQLAHPKASEWERGAQVMIRVDLQNNLSECLKKLGYHARQVADYQGWVQVLDASPDAALRLDHEDYLFFFGHDK